MGWVEIPAKLERAFYIALAVGLIVAAALLVLRLMR